MIKDINVQSYDRNHTINPPIVQKDNIKSEARLDSRKTKHVT